jgi:hypothetical protein
MVEGHVPQGVRVQVPPSAPNINKIPDQVGDFVVDEVPRFLRFLACSHLWATIKPQAHI